MRKIAITGGLAAGKSTVCRILQEYGAYIVDADEIVRSMLSPNTPIGKRVIALLGSEIVTGNQINRKKISEIVFSNPKKLTALEAILHPAVMEEINCRFDQVKNHPSYRFFVAEIPLLYEAQLEGEFDHVVAVIADERVARQRFQEGDFEQRNARQLSSASKASKADFTIVNNGELTVLHSSVQDLMNHF